MKSCSDIKTYVQVYLHFLDLPLLLQFPFYWITATIVVVTFVLYRITSTIMMVMFLLLVVMVTDGDGGHGGDWDVGSGDGGGGGGDIGASSAADGDDSETFEVDEVIAHEVRDGQLQYKTKWKNSDDVTWEREVQFETGFTISDYWRDKCESGKNKRRRVRRDDEQEDDELSDKAQNRHYEVDKALQHREEHGVIEYLVKWKDDLHTSWETEDEFDCDGGYAVLGEYWRDRYLVQQAERDEKMAIKKGTHSVSKFTFD
jgi:hypothetical protein